MKLTNPALRDWLAGSYVLGTLRGPARRRLEQLLTTDVALALAVRSWEDHTAPWLDRLAPVVPPARVWNRIHARIAGRDRWRWPALVASAAAVVLAVALWLQPAPTPIPFVPSHIAVVADTQGQPLWVLEANLATGDMHARALAGATPPAGKSYELWMLPAEGKPVSMGVLPAHGMISSRVTADSAVALSAARGLAVSLEPAGGSPSGLPTGPVLFTATLVTT